MEIVVQVAMVRKEFPLEAQFLPIYMNLKRVLQISQIFTSNSFTISVTVPLQAIEKD